eukprot:3730589-Alexandrium_andersonii.AAC.1
MQPHCSAAPVQRAARGSGTRSAGSTCLGTTSSSCVCGAASWIWTQPPAGQWRASTVRRLQARLRLHCPAP